ncbi:signal transduction histidine kinase [Rhizobium subbaraonis]|uniref:histidine kinase n=1 Tax=Rhizobium subbaraonis TaxID=908946 RepID=A0A285U245_9HYPH|nr:HAMP domain-containing sensor histidine kinase [Rhizobium subbaraonis]SOC35508.1 signal transduction histidine kinase [Rhizobium subbaraonis]
MRLLSDIADRMAAIAAAVTGEFCAAGTDAGSPAGLRAILLSSLVAVPVLPLALCAVMPVSAALPAGAALAASGGLLATAAASLVSRRRSGQRLQMAISPAPDPAGTYDLFAGLVTVHDPRGHVTAVHGRDREALLKPMRDPFGRGFIDQIHVSDRLGFLQAIDRLRQGEAHARIDVRLEQGRAGEASGQFLHVRTEMTAVRDTAGLLASIVAQSRDISEEARLRSDSARKAAEAESANDAKTRFLAAVSHELRTPLNAILGFSDILAGEYFGRLENDRQREYVALIHQSGGHLLSVVNTMLDVSKIEAGRYELLLEPFAVADSVNACEQMLALQARQKGVRLTSRVPHDIGEAVADQRALQQVLINLVGNAIKFTDKGGIVTIEAARKGRDLVLSVSDTGIGIPAEKLDLIGQPFVQVENEYTRKYEGTGLGLSLVKGLVALHGGTFVIHSDPGEGTRITITIPADGAAAAGAGETGAVVNAGEFPPRLFPRERNDAIRMQMTEGASSEADKDTGYEGRGHDGTRAKTA